MDKMTINKADLLKRLEELQKQQEGISAEIQDLSCMIQTMPEDKPTYDYLPFTNGEKCWAVVEDGSILKALYGSDFWFDQVRHRLFKSERMAKIFAEKTQFIADCLFWKEMYDSNYVPDWNISRMTWVVVFDHARGKYEVVGYSTWKFDNVCFSTEEIAQGLADWLNSRKCESNENSVAV